MIIDKYLAPKRNLYYITGEVLSSFAQANLLEKEVSILEAFEIVRGKVTSLTFSSFCYVLDLLYLLGKVKSSDLPGKIIVG